MRGGSLRPEAYIEIARHLLAYQKGKPSQAALRRAASAAYYALFYAMAQNCADMLIGTGSNSRSKHAWLEVYRSLAHGPAKGACDHKRIIDRFPTEIRGFAAVFSDMQDVRHSADYDPSVTFYRSSVQADITRVEEAIAGFRAADAKDRRAFASWVLFKERTKAR